jgi:hypothetical protein
MIVPLSDEGSCVFFPSLVVVLPVAMRASAPLKDGAIFCHEVAQLRNFALDPFVFHHRYSTISAQADRKNRLQATGAEDDCTGVR